MAYELVGETRLEDALKSGAHYEDSASGRKFSFSAAYIKRLGYIPRPEFAYALFQRVGWI